MILEIDDHGIFLKSIPSNNEKFIHDIILQLKGSCFSKLIFNALFYLIKENKLCCMNIGLY